MCAERKALPVAPVALATKMRIVDLLYPFTLDALLEWRSATFRWAPDRRRASPS
jgi:hypothetical protein